MSLTSGYQALVIGASSGGIAALNVILEEFSADFPIPVAVVLHIQETAKTELAAVFRRPGRIRVQEAEDKAKLEKGVLYLAPPGYHLLIEGDGTFSLSYEEKVNYSRPSIDVLFESAAAAYGKSLIGVVLTGGNSDGALGLQAIKQAGGLTVVEDPLTAAVRSMPESAVNAANPQHVLPLSAIGSLLNKVARLRRDDSKPDWNAHV